MNEESISKAFGWKLLERFGTQIAQFVLQLVLARLLDPEHYGALSIMIIFTTLATVFIQNGFNTALVQKKEVDDRDFSSVFWISTGIAAIVYMILFLTAPFIAEFYEMPEIIKPFRVIGLVLFPGAFNSIQLAIVRRKMDFKKVFLSNVAGILVSGALGITIAYMGGGLWALVAQNITNVAVTCIVMLFTVRWVPKLIIDFKRTKSLLSFGWKFIASGLINSLYDNLRSLVVGKKYDTSTLGYYNRGKHFPETLVSAISGTVQTVLLPAMAKKQDDIEQIKKFTRTSMVVSSYVLLPMMAGLAAISTPLISLVLTDKWLPCVPYLQIYCFIWAFNPIHSCNLQAINAIGRSDIYLKLEVVKKAVGIALIVIAVFCFDTPLAIALTGAITTIISSFVNAFPNKKLIGYAYSEQIKDILPSFLLAAFMGAAVYAINFLGINNIYKLLIQIFLGITIYIVFSMVFKLKGFEFVRKTIKDFAKKGGKNPGQKNEGENRA